MPDTTATTGPLPVTDLARRDERMPLPPMNDAEVASAMRTATALSQSGLFKDVKTAGQAFAKILAGRDLGLTPFEAMSALHVIEGKIEASADLHASRVAAHPAYDYTVKRLDNDGCELEFVRYHDDTRFVSSFTMDDAKKAGLAGRGNWTKYPRNMLFARAMSNGVAWFCPDVMGGIRIYTPGEIPEQQQDFTDVDAVEAPPVELPIAVDAIVARARTLGYAPLANRAAVAMVADGQPAEFIQRWVAEQTKTLNRVAAGKPAVEPEPPEAEVVPESAPEEASPDA